jgi:aspartyl-tRNA(Asn)/glutamyl-tRNA(Gln) amidotransferase subunit A
MTHPDVAADMEAALAVLCDAGAIVVDVALPDMEVLQAAGWTIIYAEMLSLHEGHGHALDDRDAMGAGLLAAAPFVTAFDYLKALRLRPHFQAMLDEAFAVCDALVVPGATTIAPRLDDLLCDTGTEKVDWLAVATRTHLPFNYTGNPGLVVPMGMSQGLPTSLQIVGRPHDEATILALGAAFQRQTDHHRRSPAASVAAS